MATVPLFFDILFFTFGADPTRPTSRLLGTAAPRPRFLGKQTNSCPTVFADDPDFVCCRGGPARTTSKRQHISGTGNLSPPPRVGSTFGPPMQTSWTPGRWGGSRPRLFPWDAAPRLGRASTPSTRHAVRNNFTKSLGGGGGGPPRDQPVACAAATPRPRFLGTQTASCPRVFAEAPALRLLSGSIPSTRHGVRNNFKKSHCGPRQKVTFWNYCGRRAEWKGWTLFPGKQTISFPRVFAEAPALRLLSGSIPSTGHGVRNNFQKSHCGLRQKVTFWNYCGRRAEWKGWTRFPGKQTSSFPRVFAEDPALRLLSGSIRFTRHGGRPKFKK
jgi:hypothetical protein